MFETVDNILHVTFFIAAGGLVAIVFFFVFAQTIIGSRTIHKQLEKLIEQNRQIISLLNCFKSKQNDEQSEKT
ncbi:MAG: hypothetical protein WCZ89_10355 [Phycisphaerae bacterium]